MKTALKTTAIIAASGLIAGLANAQTSPVVGFETLSVAAGSFNYLGLRLHENPAVSGTFDSSTATSLTDSAATYALDAGTLYLVELDNGTLIEALGSSFSGDTLSGLTGITAADEGPYTVRPTATLASVFGAANEAGLKSGSFGPAGADQVWVPDGAGDFNRYYYDTFNINTSGPTWAEVAAPNSAVTAADVPLVYIDGVVIVTDAASTFSSLVVSGDLKTSGTNYSLLQGFNYLSSIYPVGATLESSFGAANEAGLKTGSFGPAGADQLWIPDGAGDFDRYYYDTFNINTSGPTWAEVAAPNSAVTASAVAIDSSGIIIVADQVNDIETNAPTFYSGL